MLWQTVLTQYKMRPRDVCTNPIRAGRLPKWFYVYEYGGKIYIEKARNHANSCKIQRTRVLNAGECDQMYEYYRRRKRGDSVSAEAADYTRNQAYWYGIFADLKL